MKINLNIGLTALEELKTEAIIAYAFVEGQAAPRRASVASQSSSYRPNFMSDSTAYNQMTIRAAWSQDASQLAALAHQLLVFEKSLNEGMGDLTPWAASAEEIRKQLLRPNARFFVAEKDDRIIGYVKVVIHGRRPTRREVGTWRWLIDSIERSARRAVNLLLRRPRPNVAAVGGYIAGAFVSSEFRRSGVGRFLAVAAEDWLRSQGIPTSELHVLVTNQSARRFWEEIGYEPLTLGMRKKL